MPRKTTAFIPTVTGPGFIPLDEIPDDVKMLVEDAYAQIRKTDGRIRVQYDTKEELALEFRQMASYAAQRPAGKLRLRRSPTRDLPVTVMDFRVVADIEGNGAQNGKTGDAQKTSRTRA